MTVSQFSSDKPWPERRTDKFGNTRLIVPDGHWNELRAPELDMPLSGYMDQHGHIHYELNSCAWPRPQGWDRISPIFHLKAYYFGIPKSICEHSLLKPLETLLGGGVAYLQRAQSLLHLDFLGLRPRAEVAHVDNELRQQAIFRFQTSFNELGRWLGITRLTTYTAIIPDQKMQALGWRPVVIPTWKERWTLFKGCLPGSLMGKLRAYEIRL